MDNSRDRLASRLNAYKKEFLQQVSGKVLSLVEEKQEELQNSNIAANALGIGDVIPLFTLPDQHANDISIAQLLEQGPLVLSFYRGGWCPYCSIELRALQEILPAIQGLGAHLVAISPELPDSSLTTRQINELEFTVLSDVENRVAKEFRLVFTLDEELQNVYKEFDIDIPAHNGDESFELPLPATYVVDTDGTIRYAFVHTDYTQRAEPTDLVDVLRKIVH